MGGEGITRIDACFTNKSASNMVDDISYNYVEGRSFDHVPIHITVNQDRFQDTIKAVEQPAKLRVRSLKNLTRKQRNDLKGEETKLFEHIWIEYDNDFHQAIDSENINLAHSI